LQLGENFLTFTILKYKNTR